MFLAAGPMKAPTLYLSRVCSSPTLEKRHLVKTASQVVNHVWFDDVCLPKGWLAIAKLKSLSLFISLLIMLKKAFDNNKKEK